MLQSRFVRTLAVAMCFATCFCLKARSAFGEDQKKTSHGTLTLGDKKHQLEHAVTYETEVFDEKATAVILAARPIAVNELKAAIKERAGRAFFPNGAYVKLHFDASQKLVSVSIWADNVSINSNGPNVKSELTIKDGRARGKALLEKPEEVADTKKTYKFEVAFDEKIIAAKQ